MRSTALVAAALLLSACGSHHHEVDEAWKLKGPYDVTAVTCNGEPGTGPDWFEARITSGNTYSFEFSQDGMSLDAWIIGSSCTWGAHYVLGYSSATTFVATGSGTYSCTPSRAACDTFIVLTDGADVCGESNSEKDILDHTAVPAVGDTMDLTFPKDTWCSGHGHSDPMTFTLTRAE